MKYKVGDRVKVKSEFDFYEEYRGKQFVIEECDSSDNTYLCHLTGVYRIWFSEEKIEPADSKILRAADGTIIGEFNTGGVLPTDKLIKKEFNVTWIDKIALPTATETKEMVERVSRKILKFTNAFPKEDKKLKFTFYVTEGTRPDKKCNGIIQTMTTNIELLSGNAFDGVTTVKGSATCDKADYDERQGVLEALANAICGGNFYKAYAEAAKLNRCEDELSRTCIYCGKILDTVEEKQEHEAWHVECRKARHERYLLRKRAKEIAFEEAAQKMAQEMVKKK